MSFESSVNIPSTYTIHVGSDGTMFHVDADLDNIHVKELPTIKLEEIKVNVTNIPPIKTTSQVDLAIKEIPDTRVHLPANYHLGVSVLGICLLKVSLCGEGQIITEKYKPRRMELC